MPKPHLWIIAGPNGAGKTTLVRDGLLSGHLSQCEFINPDAITLEYLKAQGIEAWEFAPPDVLKETFIRAADDAQKLLERRIEEGASVVIESVLSTRKYCPLVERVRELDGKFMLIYVSLYSPELSGDRVTQREKEGGHGVPVDKLAPRWQASLELLPWFALRAARFWMLDNSEATEGEKGEVMLTGGETLVRLHGIPQERMCPIVSKVITQHAAQAHQSPGAAWRIELQDKYPSLAA